MLQEKQPRILSSQIRNSKLARYLHSKKESRKRIQLKSQRSVKKSDDCPKEYFVKKRIKQNLREHSNESIGIPKIIGSFREQFQSLLSNNSSIFKSIIQEQSKRISKSKERQNKYLNQQKLSLNHKNSEDSLFTTKINFNMSNDKENNMNTSNIPKKKQRNNNIAQFLKKKQKLKNSKNKAGNSLIDNSIVSNFNASLMLSLKPNKKSFKRLLMNNIENRKMVKGESVDSCLSNSENNTSSNLSKLKKRFLNSKKKYLRTSAKSLSYYRSQSNKRIQSLKATNDGDLVCKTERKTNNNLIKASKTSHNSIGNIVSFAVNTNKGIIQKKNKDRVAVYFNTIIRKDKPKIPFSFFGIYEGTKNDSCSEYFKDNFHRNLIKSSYFPQRISKAIKNCILKTQADYFEHIYAKDIQLSSISLTVFMILGKLLIINRK